MKKVITILAIMIVAACAVFAASETHTIRVKTDIDPVPPIFQLVYAKAITNNGANPVQFADAAKYEEYMTNEKAQDVDFNLNVGGSIVVTAQIANKARQDKIYTLTFSQGIFKAVSQSGEASDVSPKSIVTAAGSTFTGVSEIAQTADKKGLTVTFDGQTVVASKTTLGTATYTWPAVPNADLGTYYADIVMTVSTT